LFDNGGNLNLGGGIAAHGYGGSISIKYGFSNAQSSGSIAVGSKDAGLSGVSEGLELYTGSAAIGSSGHVTMDTRNSTAGDTGDIVLSVGTSHERGEGGGVHISAGNSIGMPNASKLDTVIMVLVVDCIYQQPMAIGTPCLFVNTLCFCVPK